ncbi:MAG: hypothetical protein ABIR55_02025 [Burkholderiaceae bacterium]
MSYLRIACSCALALSLGWSGTSFAQTAPAADAATPAAPGRPDQRIERIRIEDAGSRIDELRVGGQTQSIVVSPKDGMPAYDVQPGTTNRNLTRGEQGNGTTSGGTRVWKLLNF